MYVSLLFFLFLMCSVMHILGHMIIEFITNTRYSLFYIQSNFFLNFVIFQKETDADPHDARRGFFFAHVGWLFLTPHPEVVAKRKIIDMRDLETDPIVMWQKRLYIPLFALIAIGMPVLVHIFYILVIQ